MLSNLNASTNAYNWLYVVIGLGIIVETIYLIQKNGRKWFRKRFASWIGKVQSDITETALEDIKAIRHETTPNHGTSMNDAIKLELLPLVKEIRENQKKIELKQDEMEKTLQKYTIEAAVMAAKFEQHIREHE